MVDFKTLAKRFLAFCMVKTGSYFLLRFIPGLVTSAPANHQFFFRIKNRFYDAKFNLNTSFKIDQKIISYGYYDIKTLYTLKRFLSTGGVFVDIGANIGAIAFCARKIVGESGKIICFEPGPPLYENLCNAVIRSHFNNFLLHPYGCSDSSGYMLWNFDISNPGNAIISSKIQDGRVVQVVKIDDILLEEPRINLIKIDVEGMEASVLKGGKEVIRKNKPVIILETNVDTAEEKANTEESLNLLAQWNYFFFAVEDSEENLQEGFVSAVKLKSIAFPIVPQNVIAIHSDCIDEFLT